MRDLGEITEVFLPEHLWSLVEHARRKLRGDYLAGEEHEPKAYCPLGGRLLDAAVVTHVLPFKASRCYDPYAEAHLDVQ